MCHFSVRLCAHCIFPRSHSSITPLVQGCVLYIMLMQHDLQRCRAPATLRAVWLTRCADVAQAQDVCRGLFSNVVLAVGYFAWRPRTSVGIMCSMLGGDRGSVEGFLLPWVDAFRPSFLHRCCSNQLYLLMSRTLVTQQNQCSMRLPYPHAQTCSRSALSAGNREKATRVCS